MTYFLVLGFFRGFKHILFHLYVKAPACRHPTLARPAPIAQREAYLILLFICKTKRVFVAKVFVNEKIVVILHRFFAFSSVMGN